MSLRRHLNAEAIAHANAGSKTHERHVQRRKQDKQFTWIAEPQDPVGAEVFALDAERLGLTLGSYWKGSGADEAVVDGEAFEAHLASVNWHRRWNNATMKRKKRDKQTGKEVDVVSKVRRQRSQEACEEFVVNLSPWQMLFINQTLESCSKAGVSLHEQRLFLDAILVDIRKTIVSEFSEKSGRDVVGSYIHYDSSKIHFGVIHSRVARDNNLCGEKHLGTIGPWSVAQSRIKSLGLVAQEDTRLQDNLTRFADRFGKDRTPLDLYLHGVADTEFQKAVKTLNRVAQFEQCKEQYKHWKTKSRDRTVLSGLPIGSVWNIIRFVSPLLPEPLRISLSVARTASQAFSLISQAVEMVTPKSPPPIENNYEHRRTEPSKPK